MTPSLPAPPLRPQEQWSKAAGPLLHAGLTCIPFWWLIATPGWPANHETLRVFRRLSIFTGQWHVGHLLPVWSTTAFAGHGSPSPAIYNKLFNVLSAVLWEGLGDAKLAICGSFVVLTLVAMLGMARACRILLGRPDIAIETASGVLATYSTYATTDWLTRGAAAEYAAFALVPWLFAWCLRLLIRGEFSVWIGPLMALIALAHASIALACILPLAICTVFAVAAWPRAVRAWLRPFAISLGVCGLITAPFALAASPYPRLVSFDLLAGITPIATHLDFSRLFWERTWIWGAFTGYLTIQIDPLLLACGVGAGLLILRIPRHRLAGGFLLCVVLAALVLQTTEAFALYRVLPGATWLQFAFRLLIFLVVALALCGALLLDRLRATAGLGATWAALAAICVLMSLGKPWLGHAPQTMIYSTADIAAATVDERKAQEPWEYYPYPPDLSLSMDRMLDILDPPSATPCLGRPLDDMTTERASARFAVSCPGGGAATLPVTMAPGMRFEIDGRRVAATKICPDIHPHVRIPGDTIVTVRFPTFATALIASIRPERAIVCR